MPDLYEGLGLLDFLSFVDAHLDLYSRKLRKRTGELKQSADRLAQEADISTEKVKQRLKVIAKETWERDGIILDQARREKLERKLKDTRELMRNELRGLSEKLKEEKTVRLRDKLSVSQFRNRLNPCSGPRCAVDPSSSASPTSSAAVSYSDSHRNGFPPSVSPLFS